MSGSNPQKQRPTAPPLEVPREKEEDKKSEADKQLEDEASGKAELQELQKESEEKFTEDAEDEEDEMTQEDRELKQNLEMLVERITEAASSDDLRLSALKQMKDLIRTATSSMTAIPKPLKFLRPHFDKMKTFYGSYTSSPASKSHLADVLSVMAMTMSTDDSRECLRFKLEGSQEDLGAWGHEYLRHLSGEIGHEWRQRNEANKPVDDLSALVNQIVPFDMEHHDESGACDLLMEVERLPLLEKYVSEDNYRRVCRYLNSCASYTVDLDEQEKMLTVVYNCYMATKHYPEAMRAALRLGNSTLMTRCFTECKDKVMQMQMGFIAGGHFVSLPELEQDSEYEDVCRVMGNSMLSAQFRQLAKDLDVSDPKSPDDIYKSHLADGAHIARPRRGGQQKVDSAQQNIASTFVSALVNAGYCSDKLLLVDKSDYIYKHKDSGMLSAAASVGLLYLWNVEEGYTAADQFTTSSQVPIKAGALLAQGMISANVNSEFNCGPALLGDHLSEKTPNMIQLCAAFGLGLATVGTCTNTCEELLVPLVVDPSRSFEVQAFASLALGLTFVGSANLEVANTISDALFERKAEDLNDPMARLMGLALGLLFLKTGDKCEAMIEAINASTEHSIKRFLQLTIETCAYAGTGNVLQVQKLLSLCGEHIEDEAKNAHQAVAVLGIAMITMGEDVSAQMALRALDHILQYAEVNVRRAVPLALGLLSISSIRMPVMDTLSKLTHDHDEQVSQNAIFGLGLLGAGTNNSRIANLLRNLATHYSKDPAHLFLVRVSQGFLHMGKGLLTLNPYHSERTIMSPTRMAGLLVVLHAMLDSKNTILGSRHYLLFALACTIRPRSVICVDEKLNPVPVSVRVGQAVDTVGMAGNPREITGFQTHSTPVVLSFGEKAELAGDEYIPLTEMIEHVVVVKKNPDAHLDEQDN